MKIQHKFLTSFIASLVLSIIVHILVIAGISDTGGFDFLDSLSDGVFTAHLVSEETRPLSLPKASKKSPPDSLVKTSDEESNNGPDTKEEVRPPTEDKPDKPPVPQEDSKPEDIHGPAADSLDKPVTPAVPEATGAADKPPAESRPPLAEPVKTGGSSPLLKSTHEKLRYDLYWLNVFVGKAELEAINRNGAITITSQVHSSPFISTFYRVEDYAESTVVNGLPAGFRIKQKEGRYRSDKETLFDTTNKKITFSNYLKGEKNEHAMGQSILWDVISGFYHLRTLSFEVGKPVYIDIFDSNKFLKAEVSILRKEKLTLFDKSEVDTVIVKPLLKSDGLFQARGEILIWLTDDDNRIPVRIETKVPIGKVIAELKSLETE